jgi:hypothetical protein
LQLLQPVTQTTVTKTPPSILLSTGKTLGVDFSDVIFANQTNCYNDPFYFVNDKQTGLRAICYELANITSEKSTPSVLPDDSKIEGGVFVTVVCVTGLV